MSAQEGFVYEINPIPGHIPSAPNGLAASTTIDQVFLNWDKPDKDGGCRILEYNVYRADASTDWTLVQNHTNRTFDDWDVENGVRYRYRVAAVNHLGEGAFAELTTTVPVIPPSEPLDLTATTGNGSVTLNWTSPLDLGGGRIEAYVVYKGPTRNELEVLKTIGNVTSFVDDTAILGEFVYYAVTGRNSGGLGTQSSAVRIKPVGPPSAPGSFSAVGEDGQVTLTWAAPGSDGGAMLIGFYVYRGTTPDNAERVATKTVTQLSHVDTGVVNGVQYVYYLTAYSDVAESRPTNAIDITPFGLPGRVSDLRTTADDGQVTLDWSPPETDGGRPITKHKVYAGEGSAGAMVYLTQIGNVTTFSHTGLTNGITYFYQVTAVNEAGEGQVSETVSARPMALPGPVTDFEAEAVKGGIKLTWKLPEDLGGADSVKVWIYMKDPDSNQPLDFAVGTTQFLDINVTSGVTYRYWARTETSFGWGPTVGPVTVTAASVPGPVRNLQTAYGDGEVHLAWSAPDEDGGSPVVEYIVRRGIFVTGMVEIARSTTLSYNDTGLENGKEYLYLVVAVNAVGAGAETDPVEGKPLGPPAAPGLFKAEA
ncbi:MAG: fibronectin type III domain-containing protein, partial [Thermoplasmata archaeon]|nr:fibronectin type III domain-containing protein [Thermoplasmata archaeon]